MEIAARRDRELQALRRIHVITTRTRLGSGNADFDEAELHEEGRIDRSAWRVVRDPVVKLSLGLRIAYALQQQWSVQPLIPCTSVVLILVL
jgi:hypothetical protein